MACVRIKTNKVLLSLVAVVCLAGLGTVLYTHVHTVSPVRTNRIDTPSIPHIDISACESFTYVRDGEAREVFTTTDSDDIGRIVMGLGLCRVGDRREQAVLDSTQLLRFAMKNGSEIIIEIENGCLVTSSGRYALEQRGELMDALRDLEKKEGQDG